MRCKQAHSKQLRISSRWKQEGLRVGEPWIQDPAQALPALVVRQPTARQVVADTLAGKPTDMLPWEDSLLASADSGRAEQQVSFHGVSVYFQ